MVEQYSIAGRTSPVYTVSLTFMLFIWRFRLRKASCLFPLEQTLKAVTPREASDLQIGSGYSGNFSSIYTVYKTNKSSYKIKFYHI